jgi:ankyrin repeat protein
MDASLLTSVDGAGRCPLFYAMAYDNVDVVTYVLDTAPSCAQQTDMHGDTPLHAGCSSGSTASVEVLVSMLEGIGEDVNVANSMGMSPMHLAQNAEVMSALYAANADLKAVDNSNRSPLFVAAAMNRTTCVEFLLDCLGGDDDAVYMIDTRGDTALHAAACNGASESLLLLLQCGITPLMTNNKGLKAIDLAQKNKQKKCREILAQYHLHFATTSDFDSVLFIATLEVRSGKSSVYVFCFFVCMLLVLKRR